jgi:hypothetical protein
MLLRILFDPEEGGSKVLGNADEIPPDYTASGSRSSPLGELHIQLLCTC